MHALTTLTTLAAAIGAVNAHYVHSVLVFTRHGDRTAKFYKGYHMTNLGAQQVYQSGQFYRQRYLNESGHGIEGISRDKVVPSQVWASAPDQSVLYQTATNFLQGLYPPLEGSVAFENLNNGSDVEAPLNGYQFILIHGEGSTDPDTIWIKGDDSCATYETASAAYKNSPQYQETLASSADFYSKFDTTLEPILGAGNVSYKQAYNVFDLLNVASIHNTTVVNAPFDTEPFSIAPEDLDQLRYYANEWEWNHNFNASNPDRSIGGMSLAGGILNQLDSVVKGSAATKFSLMAGSYDTFLAFFGLTNLTAASPDFMGLPNYAASMAFELFTEDETFNKDDLMVRFLFRNGTGVNDTLDAFPLFGEGNFDIPYAQFVDKLSSRSINSLEQWCTTCGSTESFCVAANQTAEASRSDDGSDSGLSNAAAGGIGAGVTLAVVGLLAAALLVVRRRKAKKQPVQRSQVFVDPEKGASVSSGDSTRY